MEKNNKMTVLGGGLWGAVLAQHLCRGGRRTGVKVWEFFPEAAAALGRSRRHPHIPGFRLDDSVRVTADLSEAVSGAGLLVFVLPSSAVRETARRVRRVLGGRRPTAVNASKGVEKGGRTMGQILAEELPGATVLTLSGPSFAREVAKGFPTRLVLAGKPESAARRVLALFDGGALRVSWSDDRLGVELGGSLKNALAIGCGILDGLGGGANTRAALLVQGMEEMARLIRRAGGKSETIFGLAGLGDLILTGTSEESRNRSFGVKLGSGKSVRQALAEIPTVVEGLEATENARAMARRLRVKAPLIEAIWRVVHGGKPADLVMKALGFS